MKLKHLVIFGLLLVILGIAVFFKMQQKPAELVTEDYVPLSLTFDSAQVSRIEIGKGKSPKIIEIVKNEAGGWVLPTFFGARADEKKIQELFKVIPDAKGELRAKDKALFADFELTDDKAYRIAFMDKAGKSVFALLLSPKVTQYASAFIRKADSDQIFYATANFFGALGIYDDPQKTVPANDYWASLTIATPTADRVDQLEIQHMAGPHKITVAHVLRETDPADLSRKWWKYGNPGVPFPPDAAKIKQFFKIFEASPATKALDPKAKDYGFAASKWQMKLHQDNGQEILITAGADDAATQGTYLQVTGEPVVFLLPKYYFTNLDVDDSRFFGDNPLSIDAEKTEQVTVRTPAGQATFSPKTEKRDAVTRYMEDLKGFTVSKLVLDPAGKIKAKSGALNTIEIKKEDLTEPLILEVENAPVQGGKDYLAQRSNGTQPFLISEALFKKLFGDVQSLQPPADPAKK